VAIQPEGTAFNVPITITFKWLDADDDGWIDGTNIDEQSVIVTKDNVALTRRCNNEPGPLETEGAECNMIENYLKFQVSSLSDFALAFIDDQGPITSNLLADPNPVPVNTMITLTAMVDDSPAGLSRISSAEYSLDGGGWVPMSTMDGAFDDVMEAVMATLPAFPVAGMHVVQVRGWDERLNAPGPAENLFLAVYDPSGGFVTGGGWISSPAGAYVADPTLAGKATFGFVSKYQKGANVPTGSTQFLFKVADIDFHSRSYDWLVVAGAKAMYKGTGIINGEGEYGFMLSAIDGQLQGSGGTDKFRIKIWDKATETLVYDNLIGAADEANPTTVIAGGSIVVHKQ